MKRPQDQALSPHYRNDDIQAIEPEISQYLDDHYFADLPNLNQPNPKLLVVFSGGSAVGKTTISHKIEAELHGLVLENDAVKRCLLRFNQGTDKETLNKLTWSYTMQLYRRLDSLTPNGLAVRDGVIDWYFDRVLPVFEQAGYQLFIIGFEVSREKALSLIRTRGDTATASTERLSTLLDDHEIHVRRFREQYTPDVLLAEDNLFNHDLVLERLRWRLHELTPTSARS